MKISIDEILDFIKNTADSAFFFTPPTVKHGISYIFPGTSNVLKAYEIKDIKEVIKEAGELHKNGMYMWFYMTYEAGACFEEKLSTIISGNKNNPEVKFCIYTKNDVRKINSEDIIFPEELYTRINEPLTDSFRINTTFTEYKEKIAGIKEQIKNGNTYQINYTLKSRFNLVSSVSDLFLRLVFAQTAGYSAFINDSERLILSLSPELLFRISNDEITVRPMKGTIKRGINRISDHKTWSLLKESHKDRAENIMILDLLRNDIGKICESGSVEVTSEFFIEKYESVFQAVSEARGKLLKKDLYNVLKAVFPSGSITGAPKLSSMEIINKTEKEPRGIYCGGIGMATEEITMNVAIRTAEIDKNSKEGIIGTGSGVVWDSDAESEYKETLLKADFLRNPPPYFEIIETMLLENHSVFLKEYHLERIKNTSDYFLFKFDENKFLNIIESCIKHSLPEKKYKLRIALSKWGNLKYRMDELADFGLSEALVSERIINSSDRFRYFKTTERSIYDEEFRMHSKKFLDVIFFNEKGNLAEGAVTNIFIKINGRWKTPSTECGILEGCYRRYFMENNSVREDFLSLDDLKAAEKVILTNSVRKIINIKSITFPGGEKIDY